MPPVPRPDVLDQVKFITNYWWQGCEAPMHLVVQFSQKPLGDLAMIVLGLDASDIIKSWLRPGRGRRRAPARHGRKRPFSWLTFDPNEVIADRPRAAAEHYPGLDLPGARALFKVTDVADRVNITAAIVEGLGDVGFQTLWGIISLNPNLCPNMPFVNRHRDTVLTVPGVVAPSTSLPANILDNAQHYISTGPDAYLTYKAETILGWSGLVKPYSVGGCVDWEPTIISTTRGIIGQGGKYTLAQDETAFFNVSADVQIGEIAYPARTTSYGSVEIFEMAVYGFGSPPW
jgi:hypothetical protein